MFHRPYKAISCALVAAAVAWSAHAQMAQDPLLSHTASVESNIVFMFDDSASMPATFLYQYGGSPGVYGMSGPTPTTYAAKSPDVNLIYYDPRKTYLPRINANGTPMAVGSTSGLSSFNVYFYNPSSTNVYSVSGVTVNNKGSGYPSSGVTATFNAAPSGGTTATVSAVNTVASSTAQSVTMTSKGSGYPATGVTATFSAPPTGGVRATGTPTIGSATSVNTVTLGSGGSGYPAGTITASFSPAPAADGVPATATVTTASRFTVASVNVTAHGSGYPVSGKTVTFTAAPAGGVTATGTVSTATYYGVSSVTRLTGGSGYSAGPLTLTFSPPPAGGTTATGTATTSGSSPNRSINAITITNAGSGYLTAPTFTISGSTPTTAATFTVNLTTGVTGIAAIAITNPGSGYTTAPTATLGTSGGGAGATLAVVTGTSYVISGISLTNGGAGYSGTPSIQLSPAPTGTSAANATFTVTTTSTRVISGVTITNPGSGYTSTPTVSFSSASGSGAAGTVVPGTTYGISSITVGNAGAGYLATPVLTINTASGTGATWTVNTTATTVPGVNQKWNGAGSPTALTNFFNPSYLPDAGSPLASGATATLVYPNSATSATANYPKFKNRTDCGSSSSTSCTWSQEQQNYANWNAYHNNRLDLAKTGVGRAFQGLDPTFRLGWGTINTLANSSQLDAGVRLYDTTTQGLFLTWLYARTGAIGGTPNRTALDKVGQYFQRADNGGPWATSPPLGTAQVTSAAAEDKTHASCRRSYALLMTDGYYNDSFSMADIDTSTASAISSPTAYQYVPIGPYSDTANNTKTANTFADVAMKYWVTDLRPNIGNNVFPVSSDLAYWQHLNFYAIGLGLVGTLNATNPLVLTNLSGSSGTRTLNWPTPTGNDPLAIDDMWHATINGHGKMFSASSADELKSAISQMLSDVKGASGDQAGVAVSTGIQLDTSTKKFTPTYDSTFWTGDVLASNVLTSVASWEVEQPCSDPTLCSLPEKPFIDLIPSADSRNIYVGNGATSGARAVEFKYGSMSGLTSAMTGTVSQALIDYLRGDATNENTIANASNAAAIYRVRPNKLGDIVNSTPVFVKGTLNLNYDKLPTGTAGQSSYASFVSLKAARPEGVLVVGANDGMLHMFRDGIAPSQPGGIETFAYVPNALLPTLNQLASKDYVHRYYVDGPNVEVDAYIGGAWANIVVGSTGAGAGVASSAGVSPRTAVFAINTTSLNTNATSMTASSVLWEVSSSMTDFAELGYMLSDVQTGTLLDGSWVAIFGNGYESAACKAQLFVVNLQTGALIKKIDTGAGSCGASRNGLGGVRVVLNASQQIIGAYAGDLLGNLWKFNLNSSSSSAWGVDLGGSPLFTAGSAQPITAPPMVLTLPVAATPPVKPDTGYMVVAGTGKFFELADISNNTLQTLYGIWDPAAFGATATAYSGVALTNTSRLVSQTIGAAQAGNAVSTAANTYFNVTNNTVDYSTAPTKRGWQINLPNTGERVIYPMELLSERFVSVGTLSPANVSALDPCSPTAAGTAFTYVVDALSGAGPTLRILDTNGDGVVDDADLLVSGFQQKIADGRHVTLLTKKDAKEWDFCNVGGMSAGCTEIKIKCELTGTCAQAKASTVKSRAWRQLFLR